MMMEADHQSPMYITPIGSCRITGPLRQAQETHHVKLNRSGVYGYCHSSAEAVQMVRVLQGEVEVPDHIWPFLSKTDAPATPHDPSDAYVVEISSAKSILLDGWPIQLNYLSGLYPSIFADQQIGRRFWAAVDTEDTRIIRSFLNGFDLTGVDLDLLSSIRRNWANEQSLKRDFELLNTALPNVLIVTHVNARQPNNQYLPTRSKLVGLVKAVAKHMALPVYDPTNAMSFVGQVNAIEDQSEGLAHYKDKFEKIIGSDLCNELAAVPINPTVSSSSDSPIGSLFKAAVQRQTAPSAAVDLVEALAATHPELAAPAVFQQQSEMAAHEHNTMKTVSRHLRPVDQHWLWARYDIAPTTTLTSDEVAEVLPSLKEDDWIEKAGYLLKSEGVLTTELERALLTELESKADSPKELLERCNLVNSIFPKNKITASHLLEVRKHLSRIDLSALTLVELQAIQKLNDLHPSPVSGVYLKLCRYYFSEGHYQQAIDLGLRLLCDAPDNLTLRVMVLRAARVSDDPRLDEIAQSVLDVVDPNSRYASEAAEALKVPA